MLLLCLIFFLIIVVGFVGNLVVLVVIGVNRQLHDSTNILIACLATADVLFLTFCVPLTMYSYLHSWDFGSDLCYITISLQYATCYVSVWTLAMLAYERFLSITSPTKLRSIRRRKNAVWACVGIWIAAFIVNYPNMQGVGVIEQEFNGTKESYCVDSVEIGIGQASVMGARLFFWSFNFGAYILPLTLCTFFYSRLLKALHKDRLTISKSSQKMKRHATKMVLALICVFGALWLPQNVRFFLKAYSYPGIMFWERNENLLLFIQSAAQTIAYANSLANPLLYSLMSERFRTMAVRTWFRWSGSSKRSSSDVYYKQTLVSRNLVDCDSRYPDRRRSTNENKKSNAMNSLDAIKSSASIPPSQSLIPRSAVVECENLISSPMQSITEDSVAVLL